MKNKKEFYESATAKILSEINSFGLSADDKKKAVYFTKLFREAFKYDEIKQYVFSDPKNKKWDSDYDSSGFCRVASINFAVVIGVKDWQLMCIDKENWAGGSSHHYLKHVPSGKYFDITYDQFAVDGWVVPYDLGTPAPFGLIPGDTSLKFADALDIDFIGILKHQSNGK